MKDSPVCVYCLKTLNMRTGAFFVRLDHPKKERIDLGWCHVPCVDEDPLHLELADAIGMPDGVESDTVALAVYMRIRDRVAAVTSESKILQRAIWVRRDVDRPYTLRHPHHWGKRVRLVRAGPQ